jgi:hypothetical protein
MGHVVDTPGEHRNSVVDESPRACVFAQPRLCLRHAQEVGLEIGVDLLQYFDNFVEPGGLHVCDYGEGV